MHEDTAIIIGIIVGIPLGIMIGFILAQMSKPNEFASVAFERDKEGRISSIHYVPLLR